MQSDVQSPPIQSEENQLSLDSLTDFVRNPHRGYLGQTLGLPGYAEETEETPEREPFEPSGGLGLWQVQQQMLQAQLQEGSTEPAEKLLLGQGKLPLGAGREVFLRKIRRQIEGLALGLGALAEAREPAQVALNLGNYQLRGIVAGLQDGFQVQVRFRADSTTSPWRWVLAPWVQSMVYKLSGESQAGV